MRCVNCGYDNEPDRAKCKKCGIELTADTYDEPTHNHGAYGEAGEARKTVRYGGELSSAGDANLKQTVAQGNEDGYSMKQTVAQSEVGDYDLKPTVMQRDVSGYDLKPTVVHGEPEICPQCHKYPLRNGFCAKCGYKVYDDDTPPAEEASAADESLVEKVKNLTNTCPQCQADVPFAFQYCPYCGTEIPKKTIDLYSLLDEANQKADEEPEPTPVEPSRFTLTPIVAEGRQQPDVLQLELVEGCLVLKRNNIAPGNRTITSKEQAVVRYADGQWVLENLSEYNSTFVAAIRPIVLQPGDVILMGDQRFRFEPEATGE